MKPFYDLNTQKQKFHDNDKFYFLPPKRKKIYISNSKAARLNTLLISPYILISSIFYIVLFYLKTIYFIDEKAFFPNYFIGIFTFLLLGVLLISQPLYIWFCNRILFPNCKKNIYLILKLINITMLLSCFFINIYYYYIFFFL